MKNSAIPFSLFEAEVKAGYDRLVKEYLAKLDKARDGFKGKAHNSFVKHTNDSYQVLQQKLGTKNQRFLIEIRDQLEDDKDLNFELLFNKNFDHLNNTNKKSFLKDIAALEALDEMFKYLRESGLKFRKLENGSENAISTHPSKVGNSRAIKWKGKDLELVQLIYSLREGGFLTNQSDEITSLVAQVAKAFNHELSEHWQSNLSDSVNNRNNDYVPAILQKLPKAFNEYRDRMLENRKNK